MQLTVAPFAAESSDLLTFENQRNNQMTTIAKLINLNAAHRAAHCEMYI